jgi:uncharacterized protein with von Willebrand factor type A (vWA) domain
MAIEARLEERLNEIEDTLQSTSKWVNHLTTENLEIPNNLLVSYMTMNHLKSTLLYIKGDVNNMTDEVDLNLKDAMALFGIGMDNKTL